PGSIGKRNLPVPCLPDGWMGLGDDPPGVVGGARMAAPQCVQATVVLRRSGCELTLRGRSWLSAGRNPPIRSTPGRKSPDDQPRPGHEKGPALRGLQDPRSLPAQAAGCTPAAWAPFGPCVTS